MEISDEDLKRLEKYYSRTDIQEQIIEHAKDKEAVGSYGGIGYAKRPDVLMEKQDLLELFKNGITSFHCSEELWENPLRIQTGMTSKQSNDFPSMSLRRMSTIPS